MQQFWLGSDPNSVQPIRLPGFRSPTRDLMAEIAGCQDHGAADGAKSLISQLLSAEAGF